MSIMTRLALLEAAAANAKNEKIRVNFRDGHTEYLTGGECVDLWFKSDTDAVEFWAPPRSGHGLLPELLTGLVGGEEA